MPPKLPRGSATMKRKSVASSSWDPSFDNKRFRTEVCAKRYETMYKRAIIQERKLELPAHEYDEMHTQIEARDWNTLISYPKMSYPEMVKEFYANAYAPEAADQHYMSFVRGRNVPFDPDTINSLLGTRPTWMDDSGLEVLQSRAVDGPSLLAMLCRPGVQWITSSGGKLRKISSNDLRSVPKIWATFLVNNIMPCSNTSDVKVYRAQMIYAIMTGMTINIGVTIASNIQAVVNSTSNALPYPCLITLLCERAGVSKEGYLPMKNPSSINKAHIRQFCLVNDQAPVEGRRPARVRQPPNQPLFVPQRLSRIECNIEAGHRERQILMEMIRELGRAHVEGPSTPVNFPTEEEVRERVAWADPGDRDHEEGEDRRADSEDTEEDADHESGSSGEGFSRRCFKDTTTSSGKALGSIRGSKLKGQNVYHGEQVLSDSDLLTLQQLKEENRELKKRIERKEDEILGEAMQDLQFEKDRCKSLETQLHAAEKKIEDLNKEQEIDEKILRKKLQDASNMIQELLDKVKRLERRSNIGKLKR